MVETELTEQEGEALLNEVETYIEIAAEADTGERLHTLSSIQMELEFTRET